MNYRRIFQNFFKTSHINSSAFEFETTVPLLPLQNSGRDPSNEEKQTGNSFWHWARARGRWRYLAATAGILGVVGFVIVIIIHVVPSSSLSEDTASPSVNVPTPSAEIPTSSPNIHDSPDPSTDNVDPSVIARTAVDALYARQSTTLTQASGRYTLRTGRPPPPYYEQWFNFAREKQCLIDEYEQIHDDFQPFYQLSRDNVTSFQDMLDRASRALEGVEVEIAHVDIRDGEVYMTGNTAYGPAEYMATCTLLHPSSPRGDILKYLTSSLKDYLT
ncbi:hypothetical protein K438DRAFT_1766322 [Mycena galopus ATCC 62051]|nr:hypothetical protein K438DRAFT_1766322 [Mycena galopus ATCC 62051]